MIYFKVIIWIIMEVREITDLDGDVDSVHHHRADFRRSPGLSCGRAVRGVIDLKNSNDRQLVEGRSVAVQNNPLSCGLLGMRRYYNNSIIP